MSTSFTPASVLQLMCFVRVVDVGSFAKAGRLLGMTTSGVSKAISRLEAEHGVRLLHRSTHALSLTDEGEQVLDDARDVLRGCERLGLALSQAADGGRAGRVRISAPPGFTRACLLPLLPRLLGETVRRIFESNTFSTVAMMQAVLPGMRDAMRAWSSTSVRARRSSRCRSCRSTAPAKRW